MDDAQLKTVWQHRQFRDRAVPLGAPLAFLMKHTLARRVKQVGKLAAIWDEILPDSIADHTSLESFKGGVLTVAVDSSAHRFQLRQLLDGGLLRELQSRFAGPLNKVRLVPGQFTGIP